MGKMIADLSQYGTVDEVNVAAKACVLNVGDRVTYDGDDLYEVAAPTNEHGYVFCKTLKARDGADISRLPGFLSIALTPVAATP